MKKTILKKQGQRQIHSSFHPIKIQTSAKNSFEKNKTSKKELGTLIRTRGDYLMNYCMIYFFIAY